MAKKICVIIFSIFLLLTLKSIANSTPFSNTVDWNDITWDGRGAKLVDDTPIGDPYPFTYTHNVNFMPPAANINSAYITLSHWGNYSGVLNPEAWFLSDDGDVFLGKLNTSGWQYGWVDQQFSLPVSLYSGISGGNWDIGFKLTEQTSGFLDLDILAIDKSVLHGDYTPVPEPEPIIPEPETLLLLGFGLAGLVGYGKFRYGQRKK